MVLSMTGFGRGESRCGGTTLVVELRSVNHRHLELFVTVPEGHWPLEPRVRDALRSVLRRGRVEAAVTFSQPPAGSKRPVVDTELARRYVTVLRQAGRRLALAGEPDLNLLLKLPEVVRLEEPRTPAAGVEQALTAALNRAVNRLQFMRRTEGTRLAADLRSRIIRVRRLVREIRALAQRLAVRNPAALRPENGEGKRGPADGAGGNGRFEITEEIVRLDSHLAQCAALWQRREPIGRRLDFLLQEMNREINTIGSKALDVAVTQRVVAVKEELEKLREQAQNIE